MFVQVCVLAGCDFIDSLPNVSFATAVKHILNFRGAPAHLRVQRLVSKLSSSGTKVPRDFMPQFLKAETVFYHHIVFNPKQRSCEFLVDDGHDNCFPDIFQRAKESLGIVSSEDEVDLTSIAQQGEDLHTVATSTNSFLGQVRSREIVEQIYKGEVCARSLRSLSKGSGSSQKWQSDGVPVKRRAADALRNAGEPSLDTRDVEYGFRTMITQQEVSTPSPEAIAHQIENKKRMQAQERAASIRGLLSAYKATTRVASTSTESQWLTSATWTRVTLSKQDEEAPSSATHSTTILSSTAAVVESTKVTAASMKDLVAKYSQSVQASKLPVVHGPSAKIISTPGSRKRPRPAVKPVTSSARKARTLAHKTAPGTGKKTLFDFFHKQT
ncbi:hypothetical protein GN244_ATG15347 [Phytophthora infestans]|uniref:Exonuclease 1 n=1 Tax=Phytophthora infestans TaxID=4787 RepID=A0A833SMB3_PHYIN|nr:hypothetical protein GN244_ATG15347 [Phytophthora infestans]KAF4132796.1 hypothetical protein GN958_ATG18012 [Phytophthora infestans]